MAIISLWKASGKSLEEQPGKEKNPLPRKNTKQKAVPAKKQQQPPKAKPAPVAVVAAKASTEKKQQTKPVSKKKQGKKGKKHEQLTTALLPPKKRGRPSKTEVAAREQERLENERARKEQLIAIQQSILGNLEDDAAPGTVVEESGFVPNYPIYQVGDDVELVNPSLVPGEGKRRGRVTRHDITSAWVHVRWDDKCTDWRHATVIQRIPDVRAKSAGKRRGRPPKNSKAATS